VPPRLEAAASPVHLCGQLTETHNEKIPLAVIAGTMSTIRVVNGLVDVIFRAVGCVKSTVHAPMELCAKVERVLGICQSVKSIAEEGRPFDLPRPVIDSIQSNLMLVSKLAENCENFTLLDRVK
jgi:hypothetical protein